MKTVKHLSEKQKQKVQHQEKQHEKLLETVQQTIKKADPPQKVKRNNAGRNKEPRKKVMILGDSMVKGLSKCSGTKFFRIHHRRYVRYCQTSCAA